MSPTLIVPASKYLAGKSQKSKKSTYICKMKFVFTK